MNIQFPFFVQRFVFKQYNSPTGKRVLQLKKVKNPVSETKSTWVNCNFDLPSDIQGWGKGEGGMGKCHPNP